MNRALIGVVFYVPCDIHLDLDARMLLGVENVEIVNSQRDKSSCGS